MLSKILSGFIRNHKKKIAKKSRTFQKKIANFKNKVERGPIGDVYGGGGASKEQIGEAGAGWGGDDDDLDLS
jgi:hypothetical protein